MIVVEIQNVSQATAIPSAKILKQMVQIALSEYVETGSVTLRIVDKEEILQLNRDYRGKAQPTNVLSFPFNDDTHEYDEERLIGDIIICAPVVAEEAAAQNKALTAHWAHLVIHGCLHLVGFDHITDEQAAVMEPLEVKLLARIGFGNPYV